MPLSPLPYRLFAAITLSSLPVRTIPCNSLATAELKAMVASLLDADTIANPLLVIVFLLISIPSAPDITIPTLLFVKATSETSPPELPTNLTPASKPSIPPRPHSRSDVNIVSSVTTCPHDATPLLGSRPRLCLPAPLFSVAPPSSLLSLLSAESALGSVSSVLALSSALGSFLSTVLVLSSALGSFLSTVLVLSVACVGCPCPSGCASAKEGNVVALITASMLTATAV